MGSELLLRRKWTLRAHHRQVVFIKKPNEHAHHVLMKAFLWALYLPDYPDLQVETAIGDRYKPDVVALDRLDPYAEPRFWGEAGQVSLEKIHSLLRRYRQTHFAIAKWATNVNPLIETITASAQSFARTAPIDLLTFPVDSAERFIDARGEIHIRHADLVWTSIGGR